MIEIPPCKPQIYPADDPLSTFDISEWVEPRSLPLFIHFSEWLAVPDQRPAADGHRALFQRLVATWETETENLSSVTSIAMNENYQRMIGMGEPAIPLILERLQHSPGHFFWALQSITGANPVPPEAEGSLRRMSEAWLAWGRDRGYLE